MDDARGVGLGEGVRQREGVAQHLADREAFAPDELVERLAGDELHHQEIDAAGFGNVVNGDDVRMVEGGCRAGFLDEARFPVGIAVAVGRQDFDGDFASQARVAGLVDLAHAARAQRGNDLIRAQTGTGCDRHR